MKLVKLAVMEPLLKTIAKAYSQRYKSLKDICFVFPNKRCGIFLKKYFGETGVKNEELPHILTITEFLGQIAKLREATRIIQLFTLFNCYKGLSESHHKVEFDEFRVWGDIVLKDFNTVDMYLVDPSEIFKNVKDFRTLTTTFLTDDQKEIMREYFGVKDFSYTYSFWKNFEEDENLSPLKEKFINLWSVLGPLHESFTKKLKNTGQGSAGMIYREAFQSLKKKGKGSLPYKKIVAVGFNALTEAERKVFEVLSSLESENGQDSYIDFIWDASGPFLNNPNFSSSKFVISNKKYFPEPEWWIDLIDENKNYKYPQVDIVSAPSNTSQAKIVAELLKDYEETPLKTMVNEAEVAVILPDEDLLSTILYSIPEQLGTINLTMGLSLKSTPVYSFFYLLRRLYKSLREKTQGNIYYVKDLKLFFSHPYTQFLFLPEEVTSILNYINDYHKITLESNELIEQGGENFEILNFPSKKSESTLILKFITNIISKLNSKISESTDHSDRMMDLSQLEVYMEYIKDLGEALDSFAIKTSPLATMQMLERLASNEKIGFEGEPLTGLQIMGTLETRVLDFKHIFILSMNEGIMPRKAYSSTFIPETLRKGYGLPPSRYAEEVFGYYFYRLLSRAEKVTLIYDGRTVSGLRGGISRYLLQIKQYLPADYLTEISWQFHLQNMPKNDSSILKTEEIKKMTEKFLVSYEDKKNLSASSLNTYRECEVKFFLQNLLDINSDPAPGEFMDSIAIGDVLHNVMMELYLPEPLQNKFIEKPIIITDNFINGYINNPDKIRILVDKKIHEIFYKNKEDRTKDFSSGVTRIIAEQIKDMVVSILRFDLNLTPFKLYGCEISETLKIRLSSGRNVNFRFAIDRLDEITVEGKSRLRIVDYKTGIKKLKAADIGEVLKGDYRSEQIFQLFTYAWLLGKFKNLKGVDEVMTEIYYLPDLIKGKSSLPEISKEKINSYQQFKKEFEEGIENMIDSIFDNPYFSQPSSSTGCEWCGFKNYCGK